MKKTFNHKNKLYERTHMAERADEARNPVLAEAEGGSGGLRPASAAAAQEAAGPWCLWFQG